eukprot:58771-Rhodomonas_salina.2
MGLQAEIKHETPNLEHIALKLEQIALNSWCRLAKDGGFLRRISTTYTAKSNARNRVPERDDVLAGGGEVDGVGDGYGEAHPVFEGGLIVAHRTPFQYWRPWITATLLSPYRRKHEEWTARKQRLAPAIGARDVCAGVRFGIGE